LVPARRTKLFPLGVPGLPRCVQAGLDVGVRLFFIAILLFKAASRVGVRVSLEHPAGTLTRLMVEVQAFEGSEDVLKGILDF